MTLWLRRDRRFLYICLVFVSLFVIGTLFELVYANDSDLSVEQAVKSILSRRKAMERELSSREDRDMGDVDGDGNGLDDEEDVADTWRSTHVQAAFVCLAGTLFSLHTMVVEHRKWNPKSFQRFSVATKIPVEIFCVSGPLVLVSAIIYTILAGLLLLGDGSASAFFIASSWSAIMIDMSFVCYSNPLYEIATNRVDLVLHLINLITVYNAFRQLRFFPFTFVICGLFFWAVVIGIRVMRRFRSSGVASSGSFRPGSP